MNSRRATVSSSVRTFPGSAPAGRVAQNPKTLERVTVPPRKSVRFKVGRLMQQSLETNGVVAREGALAED